MRKYQNQYRVSAFDTDTPTAQHRDRRDIQHQPKLSPDARIFDVQQHKVAESMKATGLNEVFFATIVLGLNGYFIGSANGNEGMHNIEIHYFSSFILLLSLC